MGVAIVTGGSRGIGRVIAICLAEAGYDVAICFSGNEEAAQETVDKIKAAGVKAYCKKCDISKEAEVEEFVAAVREKLGSVEVLVNNAGITKDGLMLRMKETDFSEVIDVNLKGAFLMAKACLKDMMKARKGSIINITSVVGLTGNPGQVNYSASKSGLIGFTKSMAKEYGSKGIRVNAVAPGFITTAMTGSLSDDIRKNYLSQIPLNRFGEASDVAKTVRFLASEDASYITGQVISVNGGMY